MHVPTGLPVACHRIAQDFVTEAVGEPIGRVLLIVLQMVRGISLKGERSLTFTADDLKHWRMFGYG